MKYELIRLTNTFCLDRYDGADIQFEVFGDMEESEGFLSELVNYANFGAETEASAQEEYPDGYCPEVEEMMERKPKCE